MEGFVRRSAKNRSWEKAQELVNELDDPKKTSLAESPTDPVKAGPTRTTIEHAVETFLEDANSRGLQLERSRLVGNNLLLYQAKTGTPVFVPLSEDVAESLRAIPPGPKSNPNYFFWTGNGAPRSAAKDWQRSFRRLFKVANITKPNSVCSTERNSTSDPVHVTKLH